MKTRNRILAIAIAAATLVGCTKNMTIQERKDLAKGDLLYTWGMLYYINSNHDTIWAKNNPCLQDDKIVFQATNTGYIDQGACIFYPAKEKNVPFRFEQVGVQRFKLITTKAGVDANGQTWFSEGYNNADLHGEGETLYIVETYPVYQEWAYTKKSD